MEKTDSFEVRFKEGDIIFCEFEPGEEMYVIKEGKVRITKIQNNKEKTIDIIGPGEIFGEMALIDNDKRTATIIAETDVVLIRVDRNNFETLAKNNPPWALKLLKNFSRRIYDAKRKLRILSIKDYDTRVLETLIMLSEGIAKENEKIVSLNANVEDIAHWTGISPKEAEEILNRYVKMGKISIDKEGIKINNINDLKRLSQNKQKLYET
ncbi:MAG: Crp/Fnr family transcriptional regulator [Spirochaetia bacterium]|nr:Crp/Fnr family transcriptional regulator [Spirochaetota bacterium]MCX8097156.1 Crp/Fnr family transcriptional regulator [Spirochaetota bacterium]MDW8113092.1 Crp/Fnr family transcriptional regulator [Spirochaetia bacterium]